MSEKTQNSVKKMRDFYNQTPGAAIVQEEFGYYSLGRWEKEGYINDKTDLSKLFGFDPPAKFGLYGLGWCEAAFMPAFPETVLEDRGETELVQDFAGRGVVFFKGRRIGFMPTYETHPVRDMKSWEENVKWRLDPDAPGRAEALGGGILGAVISEGRGEIIAQYIIGGYMYLRSLIGPEEVMYKFFDEPELIHSCMRAWLELADAVTAEHQRHVSFDEVFLAEDICYNHGPLISPDMMREFLFPYYQQFITNIRRRQRDSGKRLYFQIDSDGNVNDIIDVYIKETGMSYMSPFEAAAGCDVADIRRRYPELLIREGIDKRILARGRDAIDREIERIMPFMKERGGYIPTCDHGVPEEVSFENYMHYRKRLLEY